MMKSTHISLWNIKIIFPFPDWKSKRGVSFYSKIYIYKTWFRFGLGGGQAKRIPYQKYWVKISILPELKLGQKCLLLRLSPPLKPQQNTFFCLFPDMRLWSQMAIMNRLVKRISCLCLHNTTQCANPWLASNSRLPLRRRTDIQPV